MKKRNKIIILFLLFLFVSILAIYLIYDYIQYRKEIKESYWEIPSQVEYESVDNYEIIETQEGKMVINENAGLSFLVPEGWNIDKISDDDTIEISSPDQKREPNVYGGFIEKGCIFWLNVNYYIQEFPGEEHRPNFILKQIQGEKEIDKYSQNVVYIDNLFALKTNKESEKSSLVLMEIPINNMIYKFASYSFLEQKEWCLIKFDEFLKTVSIDK